jgi:hypothetical protein
MLLVLMALLTSFSVVPVSAQGDQRCFAETSYCIGGRIRSFWEQNGGLAVFGLPITPQRAETIEGQSIQVQWFERNRLELHPQNAAPFDVLLGRLGADRLTQQGRNWQDFPKGGAQAGCRFFPETGHSVCDAILNAWRASGIEIDGQRGKTEAESLALFGLPLSGPVTETLSDGKSYTVQWFERARFELHPENQPPYNVLLGLLGSEIGPVASTPSGCSAVEVIDPASPAGQAIIEDLLANEAFPPDARMEQASLIDRFEGWVIFTGNITNYETGIFLMRPTADGGNELVTVWGGIAEDGDEQIRDYFREQAPDAPPTLIDCWTRRYI